MKINDIILDIDKIISFQQREIGKLNERKIRFQRIKDQFPNADYENGAICLDNIWDKITCMRIDTKRRYYSTSKVVTRFMLGKRATIDGFKVCATPYENIVAEIRYNYGQNAIRKKDILIFDYKKLIPAECPKRNSFIKRIKLHLVDRITKEGLTIDEKSFDRDEINKLILLK